MKKKTPFTNHIFKLIDEDGSGEVDKNEFVGMMCLYCMYSKEKYCGLRSIVSEDKSGVRGETYALGILKCC